MNSLNREVLIQVSGMETLAQVWSTITSMYSSQSRARVMQIRMQLAGTQKKEMSIADYVAKMKGLADSMASAGHMLDDDDLVTYILSDLDVEWNPLVSAMTTRTDPVSLSDLSPSQLQDKARDSGRGQRWRVVPVLDQLYPARWTPRRSRWWA